MLRDRVKDYYLNQNYNCAETMARCINDEYRLGATAEALSMVSGFGGGLACGYACGALCGGLAMLGYVLVQGKKAHETEGFRELCREFTEGFAQKTGSVECSELTPVYKREEIRCMETVLLAADWFEEFCEKKSLAIHGKSA